MENEGKVCDKMKSAAFVSVKLPFSVLWHTFRTGCPVSITVMYAESAVGNHFA